MLNIEWEWMPAEGVRSAELAATFARLQLAIGDDYVTLVEDQQTRSSRRSVTVSLYPLAEWLVFNWWFLRAGARAGHANHSYDSRHSLRASGDGFLWPNLKFFPEGTVTRLIWQRDKLFAPHSTLRYLAQGEVRVSSTGLQFVLANFVSSVIERLDELGVEGTALQAEWIGLRSIDEEETEFCIAAARLGLDPFADGPKFEAEIIEAATRLPSEILATFYDAVSPGNIGAAISWVVNSLSESEHHKDVDDIVLSARERVRSYPIFPHSEPWQVGWGQAAAVRDSLGLDVLERIDVEGLVRPVTRVAPEAGFKAAGLGGSSPSKIVIVGKSYPSRALRFTLARALWHLVAADADAYLVTSAHTEDQRIERAFAAELLAPARGIAETIGAPEAVEDEDLESVADAYAVATTVIEHQLRNQVRMPAI